LLLRMFAKGLRDFWFENKDWRWNVFDTVVVLISFADFISDASQLRGIAATRIARTCRLMRVGKVMRVLRLMRYVHEFKKIFLLLGASMQTLIWSCLAVFFVLYVFAVLFTQTSADYLWSLDELTERNQMLHQDFSTIDRSLFTLYTAVAGGGTMGRNWGTFYEELSDVDDISKVLFIAFVTFAFFGMLNIVTSVFVECAMASTQRLRELLVEEKKATEQGHLHHMRNIFHELDTDGSNSLSYTELREALVGNIALQEYFLALDLNATDTSTLFELLDEDGSGELDIDEFCDGCMRLKGEARAFDINCVLMESRKSGKVLFRFIKQTNEQFQFVCERLTTLQQFMLCSPSAAASPMARLPHADMIWDPATWVQKDDGGFRDVMRSGVPKPDGQGPPANPVLENALDSRL